MKHQTAQKVLPLITQAIAICKAEDELQVASILHAGPSAEMALCKNTADFVSNVLLLMINQRIPNSN